MAQATERSALQILAILLGEDWRDVVPSYQSLEQTMEQVRDALLGIAPNGAPISGGGGLGPAIYTGLPTAVTPGDAGSVGSSGDASPGDHEHPATDVPTIASVQAAQADADAAQAAADAAAAAAAAGSSTSSNPPLTGRDITIGTQITHATKPTGEVHAVAFPRANRQHLFVGSFGAGDNALRAYPLSLANPPVFSTPVVAATGVLNVMDIDVRPNDAHVAVAENTAPYLQVWPWSGSAWGTVILPATLPDSGGGRTVAWHPDGDFLALGRSANSGNPEVLVFPFDGATLGTAITLASVGEAATGIAWSADGLWLFVAFGTIGVQRLRAYPFDGVTLGAPVTPASQVTGAVTDVAVSPDGAYVAISTSDTNGIWVYPWDGAAFGTPIKEDPSVGGPNRLAWAPDRAFIGVGGGIASFAGVFGFDPAASDQIGPETAFTLTGSPVQAFDIDFSYDGRLAAAAYDGTVKFGVFPGTRAFGF